MAITNNYIGVMTKIYLIRHCKSEGGANAVLFYASDLSDYMNVNGGLYM